MIHAAKILRPRTLESKTLEHPGISGIARNYGNLQAMVHFQVHPYGTQMLQDMIRRHTPQPLPGSTGDFTARQLHIPSSNLPHGGAGASAHGPKRPGEDTVKKREFRLMKNREAARQCRRKKKEYVKCLEDRVAMLENQNKTLIEELRALKDIYRNKMQ